jgi:hypothetical protein
VIEAVQAIEREIEAHVTAMEEYEDGAAFTTIASDALTVTPDLGARRRQKHHALHGGRNELAR